MPHNSWSGPPYLGWLGTCFGNTRQPVGAPFVSAPPELLESDFSLWLLSDTDTVSDSASSQAVTELAAIMSGMLRRCMATALRLDWAWRARRFMARRTCCGTRGNEKTWSNYTLSGSITGFWALAGLKRTLPAGLLGALVGAAVGTSVKVGGDWLYDTSREAWLSHRIHRLEFSRPRLLEKAHKPAFHPKDSRLQHQPAPAETKESLAPPLADKSGGALEGTNAKPKKGWLW